MGFELHNAQRFYETLALIIGNREGVSIKVTVTEKKKSQHPPMQSKKESRKGEMTSE